MNDALNAFFVLLLLMVSAALGMFVKAHLSEQHKSRETVELVSLVVTMLVTFAALVMGLLTYAVKGGFDRDNDAMAAVASQIVQLDQSLRNYGPEAMAARIALRRYTETVIVSTWPNEPKPRLEIHPVAASPIIPGGLESRTLGELMNEIGLAIHHLAPQDALHRALLASALGHYHDLEAARWTLIEDARPTISFPFYLVLVFWLIVIFVCFGLNAPANAFVFIIITLSALSISSAMFVILEMDSPFNGYVEVSSRPMRNALIDIVRPTPAIVLSP